MLNYDKDLEMLISPIINLDNLATKYKINNIEQYFAILLMQETI
jgi:hypothetical protein